MYQEPRSECAPESSTPVIEDNATCSASATGTVANNSESTVTGLNAVTTPGRDGAAAPSKGVGPWPGGPDAWPEGDHWDPDLLANGDQRNVEDRFRYWKRDFVKAELDKTRFPFHVAIENLDHDFNIGSIVRSANAFGAQEVHIIGRHRWNRRGAMVTDRYQHVDHFPTAAGFVHWAKTAGFTLIGIDNVPGSKPLELAVLGAIRGTAQPTDAATGGSGRGLDLLKNEVFPAKSVLIFGSEANGLSSELLAHCESVYAISQFGSTRSINVGAAAAVAMWGWVLAHGQEQVEKRWDEHPPK